jgi:hypothetical protein
MSNPGSRNQVDGVQLALEAICDALVTLESICADNSCGESQHLHLVQAVSWLRHSVAELRLVNAETASILALGFVCEPENESDSQRAAEERGQSSPRRTA